MIANYLGTAAYVLITWCIGLSVIKITKLEQKGYKTLSFLSIPIGMSLSAVLASLIYLRLGQSVTVVRIFYLVAFISGIIILFKYKTDRKDYISLFVTLGMLFVLSIPALIVGEKLYVHKGNIYDHYYYISEVIYMSMHKFRSTDILSDVTSFGLFAASTDRPVTPLLCAVLCGKSWGNVFFQAYLFNMTSLAAMVGVINCAMEIITSRFEKISLQIISLIIAIAYVFGFYGQIQYDINAWSQLTAMPCLLTYVIILSVILPELEKGISVSQYLLLAIMGAGLFLIYPENTMLYGAFILLCVAILLITRKVKIKPLNIVLMILIPLEIVLLASLIDFGTVKFSFTQFVSGDSDIRQSWCYYFDSYWKGCFPYMETGNRIKDILKLIIAFIPSASGIYYIVPYFELGNKVLLIPWILFDVLVCIGLAALVLYAMARIFKYLFKEKEYEPTIIFRLFAVFGLATVLFYMVRNKDWTAGKVLLYFSPFIYLIYIYPFMEWVTKEKENGKKKTKKIIYTILITVSSLYVLSQGLFIVGRVHNIVTNPNGTGYLGSYPSDQFPYLKESFEYNFDASAYKGEDKVAVMVDDPWYQSYIEMCLSYEDIEYYSIPDYEFNYNILRDNQPEYTEGDPQIK